MEHENSLEDYHVRTVHRFCCGLAGMCDEIVDGHLDLAALLQLAQYVDHQVNVEGVRMIEVVFVALGLVVLFLVENLYAEEDRVWLVSYSTQRR